MPPLKLLPLKDSALHISPALAASNRFLPLQLSGTTVLRLVPGRELGWVSGPPRLVFSLRNSVPSVLHCLRMSA